MPLEGINYVYADHLYGGYLATRHLIQLGSRSILCITERERQFRERTEGYRKAHAEAGLPVYEHLIRSCDATFDEGYRTVRIYEQRLGKIDGIFAQSDIAALGALEALRELGIDVPGQIPVVGYDDIRMSGIVRPRLTTVHQPHREIVQRACSRLVAMLSGTKTGSGSGTETGSGSGTSAGIRTGTSSDTGTNTGPGNHTGRGTALQEIIRPRLIVRETAPDPAAASSQKAEGTRGGG
jgi:DNA-binding LacI/PurR family transcriptional regulator